MLTRSAAHRLARSAIVHLAHGGPIGEREGSMRVRGVASVVVGGYLALSQAGCDERVETVPTVDAQQKLLGPTGFPPPDLPPGSYCDPSDFGQWCFYNPRPSGDWWRAVAGWDHSQMWIGGSSTGVLHFDGVDWRRLETGLTEAESFAVFSPQNVWVVGQDDDGTGTISHFDGTAFTVSFQGMGDFQDIWGSGPNNIYAVSFSGTVHWNGTAWTPIPGVAGQSISGTAANDVWVAKFDGLLHFNGAGWHTVPALQGKEVIAVRAISRKDVWVAALHPGGTDLEHFNGTSWSISTTVTGNRNIYGVGAGGPNDVWAVGNDFVSTTLQEVGLLMHFNGHTWTTLPHPPALVSRMASIGHNDFAVGQAGEILHLTPNLAVPFTNLTQGPTATLHATWGSSRTDMWAVGEKGTVLHYDGQVVTSVHLPPGPTLNDVSGTSPTDAWMSATGGPCFTTTARPGSPSPQTRQRICSRSTQLRQASCGSAARMPRSCTSSAPRSRRWVCRGECRWDRSISSCTESPPTTSGSAGEARSAASSRTGMAAAGRLPTSSPPTRGASLWRASGRCRR